MCGQAADTTPAASFLPVMLATAVLAID